MRESSPTSRAALDDLVARMLAKDPHGAGRATAARSRRSSPRSPASNRRARSRRSRRRRSAESSSAWSRWSSVKGLFASRAIAQEPPGPRRRTSPTLEATTPAARDRRAPRARARFGAELEPLADGSIVVRPRRRARRHRSGRRRPRAAPSRSAPRSRARRWRSPPAAPVVGRSLPSARRSIASRASSKWSRAAPATARGVRLDDVTQGLLDARFEVDERRDAPPPPRASATRRGRDDPPRQARRPCVGRERELALLESILAEVASRARRARRRS